MALKKGDKREAGRRSAKKVFNAGGSSRLSRAPPPSSVPPQTPKPPAKKGSRVGNAASGTGARGGAKQNLRSQKLPTIVHQAPPPQRRPKKPPTPPLVQGKSVGQRACRLLQPQIPEGGSDPHRRNVVPEVQPRNQSNNCVRLSRVRRSDSLELGVKTPNSYGHCIQHRRATRTPSPFPDLLNAHKSAPNISSSSNPTITRPESLSRSRKYDGSQDLPRQISTPNMSIHSSIQNLSQQFANRPFLPDIHSHPQNNSEKSLNTLHSYVSSIENRISSMEVDFIPSVEKLIQDVSNSIHQQMSKNPEPRKPLSRRFGEPVSQPCPTNIPHQNPTTVSSVSAATPAKQENEKPRYVERMDLITRRLFKNKEHALPNIQPTQVCSSRHSDRHLPQKPETRTLRTYIA